MTAVFLFVPLRIWEDTGHISIAPTPCSSISAVVLVFTFGGKVTARVDVPDTSPCVRLTLLSFELDPQCTSRRCRSVGDSQTTSSCRLGNGRSFSALSPTVACAPYHGFRLHRFFQKHVCTLVRSFCWNASFERVDRSSMCRCLGCEGQRRGGEVGSKSKRATMELKPLSRSFRSSIWTLPQHVRQGVFPFLHTSLHCHVLLNSNMDGDDSHFLRTEDQKDQWQCAHMI